MLCSKLSFQFQISLHINTYILIPPNQKKKGYIYISKSNMLKELQIYYHTYKILLKIENISYIYLFYFIFIQGYILFFENNQNLINQFPFHDVIIF